MCEIGGYAFENCSSLKKVDLTGCSGLTNIEGYAFSGCSSMTTLNLPSSISTIGEKAFGGCKALANLTVPTATPPTAASDAFYQVSNYNCLLVIPAGKTVRNAYVVADAWGAFIDVEKNKGIDVTVEEVVNAEGEEVECGYVTYDRDYSQEQDDNASAKSFKSPQRRKLLADETIVPETKVTGIDGHIENGLSLYIPEGGMVSFLIVANDGYKVESVLYGEDDVTSQLVNGVFTTPAVNANTTLKVKFAEDTVTEIEKVIVNEDETDSTEVEYYNLQGVRVMNPTKGMYIKRQGSRSTKVIL